MDLKRKMDIITTLDGMKSMKVLFALPIIFLFIRVGYQIAYVKDYMMIDQSRRP